MPYLSVQLAWQLCGAVFADVGVVLLPILNVVRLKKMQR